MNDRGNITAGLGMLVLIAICLFFMVQVLNAFHSEAVAGCAWDENGTMHNCSITDAQYTAVNITHNNASAVVSVGSIVPLFLAGCLGCGLIAYAFSR